MNKTPDAFTPLEQAKALQMVLDTVLECNDVAIDIPYIKSLPIRKAISLKPR
jgi:hypothetical protein